MADKKSKGPKPKGNHGPSQSKNSSYGGGKLTTTSKNRDGAGKPGGLKAPRGKKVGRSKA